jgi:hypothetical protein
MIYTIMGSFESNVVDCGFAVCAISSQFYTKKSEIYPIVMHFARHSAATNTLIDASCVRRIYFKL